VEGRPNLSFKKKKEKGEITLRGKKKDELAVGVGGVGRGVDY